MRLVPRTRIMLSSLNVRLHGMCVGSMFLGSTKRPPTCRHIVSLKAGRSSRRHELALASHINVAMNAINSSGMTPCRAMS